MMEEGGEIESRAAVTSDFPLNASLEERAAINGMSFGRKDDQTAGHTREVKKRMHRPLSTPFINPAIVTPRVIWESLRFKQNIFPYGFQPLLSSVFSFGPRSKADVFICHSPDKHRTYEERLIFTFEMQMNMGQRNPCAVDVDWLEGVFWVCGVQNDIKAGAQNL